MVPMLTSHYYIWALRETTVPLFKQNIKKKNSKFSDINANNNDNKKIKIIVCSLQNECIY